jgi:hypothetical protein
MFQIGNSGYLSEFAFFHFSSSFWFCNNINPSFLVLFCPHQFDPFSISATNVQSLQCVLIVNICLSMELSQFEVDFRISWFHSHVIQLSKTVDPSSARELISKSMKQCQYFIIRWLSTENMLRQCLISQRNIIVQINSRCYDLPQMIKINSILIHNKYLRRWGKMNRKWDSWSQDNLGGWNEVLRDEKKNWILDHERDFKSGDSALTHTGILICHNIFHISYFMPTYDIFRYCFLRYGNHAKCCNLCSWKNQYHCGRWCNNEAGMWDLNWKGKRNRNGNGKRMRIRMRTKRRSGKVFDEPWLTWSCKIVPEWFWSWVKHNTHSMGQLYSEMFWIVIV